MDATLVTVTVLSMTMAAALSAIVWRMLRIERQRSNARVTALAAAALGAPRPAAATVTQAFRSDENDLPLAPRISSERGPIAARGFDEAAMFTERPHESPWGTRFAVMLALGLLVASVVLFSLAAHPSRDRATRTTSAPTVSQAAAPTADAQLDLMSLHDARQADSLTITGIVQNPRTGVRLSRVAVTAYAFDERGSFLASGRALLDVTALAPGDESPFTVTVPAADKVARYRIGFRDETGRVIAHIDRRDQGSRTSDPGSTH